MTNKLKKVTILSLIAVLLVTMMPAIYANDDAPIKLIVNGSEVTTDVPPILVEGRTLVPIRFVSDALEVPVRWEQSKQAVLINSDPSDAAPRGDHIQLIVNGESVTTDVPPLLVSGRTLVPIRFVSDALGATIHWNQQTRTVTIEKAEDGSIDGQINYHADVDAELVIYDPFQSGQSGQKPTDYVLMLTDDAQAAIENVPTEENRSLLVSAKKGTAQVAKEFAPIAQMATVEFKWMQQSKANTSVFQMLDAEQVLAEIVTENDAIVFRNGDGQREVLVNGYDENIWYTLKMVTHLDSGHVELFVNESPVKNDAKLGSKAKKLNTIKFLATDEAAYYVDDVIVGAGRLDVPMGFATVGQLPTGGLGGETYIVENLEQFLELVRKGEPLTIKIAGTIDMGGKMHAIGSDKTIVGIGDRAVIKNGGFKLERSENVIIRSLLFDGSPDDAIEVRDMAKNIWIDHNTFQNAADGLLDIRRQASFVTVSWNLFQNHGKTSLVGSGDNDIGDRGYLKVTYHHNKFYNTRTRHPMVRFGEVHVLNNYYDSLGSYAARANKEASLLVESNYFYKVKTPTEVFDGNAGDLEARNNMLVESGQPEVRGKVFEPYMYYTYSIDPAEQINKIVDDWVGAGRLYYY